MVVISTLCGSRPHAKLRQHRRHIEVVTHKLYFAVFHFDDLARADLDGFVGGRNLTGRCLKRTAMRAPPRELENDGITGDLDRVDCRPRIQSKTYCLLLYEEIRCARARRHTAKKPKLLSVSSASVPGSGVGANVYSS